VALGEQPGGPGTDGGLTEGVHRRGGEAAADAVDGPAVGFVGPGGDVVAAPFGEQQQPVADGGELRRETELVLEGGEFVEVPVEDGLGGASGGEPDGVPGDVGVAVVVAADPGAGPDDGRVGDAGAVEFPQPAGDPAVEQRDLLQQADAVVAQADIDLVLDAGPDGADQRGLPEDRHPAADVGVHGGEPGVAAGGAARAQQVAASAQQCGDVGLDVEDGAPAGLGGVGGEDRGDVGVRHHPGDPVRGDPTVGQHLPGGVQGGVGRRIPGVRPVVADPLLVEVLGEVGEQPEVAERPDHRQGGRRREVTQPVGETGDVALALPDGEGRPAGRLDEVEDRGALLFADDVTEDGAEVADVLPDAGDDVRGVLVRRHRGDGGTGDGQGGAVVCHGAIVPLADRLRSGGAEPGEVLAVEARPADQATVDVRLADELTDRVGLHRAAVEDPQRGGGLLTGEVGDHTADGVAHLLGVGGGGHLAGTDRPDRFVGDDDVGELVGGDPGERGPGLVHDVADVVAGLADLERFPDADDGPQPVSQGGDGLGGDGRVVLGVVLAAFGVSDDDPGAAELREHRGGDLAGVGAGLVGGDVLRPVGEQEFVAVDEGLDAPDVGERRDDGHVDVVVVVAGQGEVELLHHLECLQVVEVHLPVAGDERGARGLCHVRPPLLLEDGDAGQFLALEEFEGGTAAGGDVAEPVLVEAEGAHGRGRVATADDGEGAGRRGVDDRLGDPTGPVGEGGELEHAHRTVPEHGLRTAQHGAEGLDGRRADVQAHLVVGHGVHRDGGGRAVGGEGRRDDDVGGQHDDVTEPLEQVTAGIDHVLLQQGGAHGQSLRGEEGEAHAAADDEAVDLRGEGLDDPELVGDLRSAQDDGVGVLRVLGDAAQHRQLGLDQAAGVVRQQGGDIVDGGLPAVDHAETVGDEGAVVGGQCGEFRGEGGPLGIVLRGLTSSGISGRIYQSLYT
jgi:hypothetical protein